MTHNQTMSAVSAEDLVALQQHYLRRAMEIGVELASRVTQMELDSRDLATHELELVASIPTDPGAAQDRPRRVRADSGRGRRRRSIPTIEAVLAHTSDGIREATQKIIEAGFILDGVGEPVPERPAGGRTPRYIRLVWARKTFAYINVRADHLRIDLPLDGSQIQGLQGNLRVRDVQETNPWKVSLYVQRDTDVEPAVAALHFVHGMLQRGEL